MSSPYQHYYSSPGAESHPFASPVSTSPISPGGVSSPMAGGHPPMSPVMSGAPESPGAYRSDVSSPLPPMGAGGAAGGAMMTGPVTPAQQDIEVAYICGSCGAEVKIKVYKDALRCRECTGRIMYKKRSTKKIQFEAR